MIAEIVFLLEERSMKEFLAGLLPRLLPADVPYILIAHEGKSDLEASLPRKLRAWRTPGAKFVVARDQDSADCREVKRHLVKLAEDAGRTDVVVRIACRELEAWVLGDLEAVGRVFQHPRLADISVKRKFRDPDALGAPAKELRDLLGGYSKTDGARGMGVAVDPYRSSSKSFLNFVSAVRALVEPRTC
jgi:hypothetical protein